MNTENLTAADKAALADPVMLRQWAIERAISTDLGRHEDIVKAAGAFVDFVTGKTGTDIADEVADGMK